MILKQMMRFFASHIILATVFVVAPMTFDLYDDTTKNSYHLQS